MKFKLAPVRLGNDVYQISHQFTAEEIVNIMLMPKIGKKLSFEEAYSLRFHELSYKGKLFRYTVQATPLDQYCMERGYYIEFKEGEIYAVGERTKIQH
jgi:hypothetical protein